MTALSHLLSSRGPISLAGSARSILAAERVALNFMQRMSGIATATKVSYVLLCPSHGVR